METAITRTQIYSGFALLTIVLLGLIWLTFSTYDIHDEDVHAFVEFASANHVLIMAMVLAITLVYGFFSAKILFGQVSLAHQETQEILSLMLQFLSREEQNIVIHLAEREGKTSQAEISRLPGLTRLKAHRCLQKLQEKGIITIIPHGKVRRIILKAELVALLMQQDPK